MWLGAHVGIATGLAEAPVIGRRIGCEAIQIFSKSPKLWDGAPIAPEAAEGFAAAVRRESLHATAVHHGYLVNLASPKPPMLKRSRSAFVDEIHRATQLGVDALIFHPGAHLGSGAESGLATIAESINGAIAQTPESRVRLLLENAAGQGTALCSTFAELATVLAKIDDRSRVGVAIDTCHLFAAGTDFRTPATYGAAMDALARDLGRKEVRAFHLNDAKAELGSHRDRHENIGRGQIGTAGFASFVNDPGWAEVPGYLETPLDDNDYALYETDLATLRSLRAPEPAPHRTTGRAKTVGRRPRARAA